MTGSPTVGTQRSELDVLPCGALTFDTDLHILSANATLANHLGYRSADALIGQNFETLLGPASKLSFHLHVMPQLQLVGQAEEVYLDLVDVDGSTLPVLLYSRRAATNSGDVYHCAIAPIRLRQSLERDLLRARRSANQAPGGIYQMLMRADGTCHFTYTSAGFMTLFGLTSAVLREDARPLLRMVHPDDRRAMHRYFTESREFVQEEVVEFRIENQYGEQRWLEFRSRPETLPDGETMWYGYMSDISPRKQLEAIAAAELELSRFTIAAIGDAVITITAKSRVESMNPAAERLTGWRLSDAHNHLVSDLLLLADPTTGAPVENPTSMCFDQQRIVSLDSVVALRSRTGQESLVEISAAPVRDMAGVVSAGVLVLHDVTTREQLSDAVEFRSQRDQLTGLVNRAEIERQLDDLIRDGFRGTQSHAFCLFDLDQFKIVNETLGYAAGDALLVGVADILRARVSGEHTVSRLNGDRFAVLLRDCDEAATDVVIEHIAEAFSEYRFEYDRQRLRVTTSIGIAMVSPWASPSGVLKAAEQACFVAKASGHGAVHRHVAVDDEVRAQQAEMAWATRVASALEAGDLVLYAQPIAALARPTNRVHFEVLLRLVDRADGTIVAPGAFMPAAERYGLAPDIDRWVVSTAIAWLGQQPPEVIEQLDTIAINLSGVSMGSRTFERFLTDLLDQHASVAHHICFEITETAAVSNLDQAVSLIEQVQSRGASVALDDFGVGMSSLAYLKRLPVDYVKIDGQFVRDIATDPLDLAMVRSINDIAHLMGKQTIAEFVETESVLVLLRSLGVDHAQGYFIGKPAPLDTVISAASASTASPSRSMSSRPT